MSEVSLELSDRDFSLSLPDRNIKPATETGTGSGSSLATNLILQGFGTTFDTTGFLLYGLYEGSTTTTYLDQPGILTLRRRNVALTVAQ